MSDYTYACAAAFGHALSTTGAHILHVRLKVHMFWCVGVPDLTDQSEPASSHAAPAAYLDPERDGEECEWKGGGQYPPIVASPGIQCHRNAGVWLLWSRRSASRRHCASVLLQGGCHCFYTIPGCAFILTLPLMTLLNQPCALTGLGHK